jgi:hypothetical protein
LALLTQDIHHPRSRRYTNLGIEALLRNRFNCLM